MKVIVDDKIPYIREAIENIAQEVVYLPGSGFTPEAVRDADALIVRTRTKCNRELLEGSKVQFIATATIGFDHIDIPFCKEAGITWKNAPGCNAPSVAQYIQSVLLLLKKERGLAVKGLTMGIVGVGNVGSRIEKVAEEMGMRVLRHDPPREANEGSTGFVSLPQIMEESDIITFHVPLNKEGIYRTLHLADSTFFASLRKKPVIINTSRGEVVETQALLHALDSGQISDAIIDVWEHEPDINRTLLQQVMIGTPHIAGYSADGKANATEMSLRSLCTYFHLPMNFDITPPSPEQTTITASSIEEALLQIYNPHRDSDMLKAHPEKFEWLRGNYPLRREKKAYRIVIASPLHAE
jgi:erythronate-4-phosphate dehydrogenase